MADNSLFLPWEWSITPEDTLTTKCPSAATILGTFAIINVVATVLGVFFGHRIVLNRLTCGILGRNKNSSLWKITWVFPFGLQLGANALIAAIIKHTPGYNANFKIWELMLFFTARPRLSWIVVGFLGCYDQANGRMLWIEDDEENGQQTSRLSSLAREEDFPWLSTAMSQMVAEVLLKIISLYIMGITANFAASRGYYKLGETYNSLPHFAHLMYAGALYFLVVGTLFLLTFIIHLVQAFDRSFGIRETTTFIQMALVISLVYIWMGSWIFWAGFVHLAGNL